MHRSAQVDQKRTGLAGRCTEHPPHDLQEHPRRAASASKNAHRQRGVIVALREHEHVHEDAQRAALEARKHRIPIRHALRSIDESRSDSRFAVLLRKLACRCNGVNEHHRALAVCVRLIRGNRTHGERLRCFVGSDHVAWNERSRGD